MMHDDDYTGSYFKLDPGKYSRILIFYKIF